MIALPIVVAEVCRFSEHAVFGQVLAAAGSPGRMPSVGLWPGAMRWCPVGGVGAGRPSGPRWSARGAAESAEPGRVFVALPDPGGQVLEVPVGIFVAVVRVDLQRGGVV